MSYKNDNRDYIAVVESLQRSLEQAHKDILYLRDRSPPEPPSVGRYPFVGLDKLIGCGHILYGMSKKADRLWDIVRSRFDEAA